MSVDRASYDRLLHYTIPEVEHTLSKRDTMLYALGVGLGGTCCDYDPTRLKSMEVRFSAPVYPGETLRTEMWRQGNVVSFRCATVGRGKRCAE
jgi:hypothetical protein